MCGAYLRESRYFPFSGKQEIFFKDIRLQRIHALYLKAAENASSSLLESPADPVIRAGTRQQFHA